LLDEVKKINEEDAESIRNCSNEALAEMTVEGWKI